MTKDQVSEIKENMPRSLKVVLDKREGSSEKEARALFARSHVVVVPPTHAELLDIQAAILTTAVLAPRTFIGNVSIAKTPGLDTRTSRGATISALLSQECGVHAVDNPEKPAGQILIGDANPLWEDVPSVRCISAGWRGGIQPGDFPNPPKVHGNILSGILASGLAVTEIYRRLICGDSKACKRRFGFSLWDLSQGWEGREPEGEKGFQRLKRTRDHEWLSGAEHDDPLEYMPRSAWFAGLGHLGQAYLWVMGLLALLGLRQGSSPTFFLQDIGRIKGATHSTSVLTLERNSIDEFKTRVCAERLARFYISTHLVERRFDSHYYIREGEPKLAFGGFDNGVARRAWKNTLIAGNFWRIIDGGLGANAGNFDLIKIFTFPENIRSTSEIWRKEDDNPKPYNMEADYISDLNECGQESIAGYPVGVPSIGMTAAAFAVGEALRMLHGGATYHAMCLDLNSPNSIALHAHEQPKKYPDCLELQKATP